MIIHKKSNDKLTQEAATYCRSDTLFLDTRCSASICPASCHNSATIIIYNHIM